MPLSDMIILSSGIRESIESVVSTFPLDVTRTVEAIAGGARVTAIVKGAPTGLMRLFNPIMKTQVQRSIRADYARLKALLEESA